MTNEEIKKKICKIIADNYLPKEMPDRLEDYKLYRFKRAAEALIAAGIGDVKEAEHRAARAERALESACQDVISIMEFIGEDGGVITIKNYVPENSSAEAYLKRAEKELAEEKKDEQS